MPLCRQRTAWRRDEMLAGHFPSDGAPTSHGSGTMSREETQVMTRLLGGG